MRTRSNLVLAGLACLPAASFAATPAITLATGTVQTGQTLTIAGSGLNDEAKANWDSFFVKNPNAWSFEGSSPLADGYSKIGPKGGVYDTAVQILGSKSIRFRTQGATTTNLGNYNAIDPTGTDLWVRAYVRWNLIGGGWPSNHIKMLYGAGGYYYQPTHNVNGTLPSSMSSVYNEGSGNVTHNNPIPSGQLKNNRWYAMEVHWKDTSPLVFDAWVDGVQVHSGVPGIAGGLKYLLFGLVNLCCTNSAFSLDHWIDGLAVGTQRIYPSTIVEVGNSSNYSTAAKTTQELIKISDSQLQLKLDLSGLGSGPYYLWVTNNRQARSQAYVLGQGGGSTLSSPQNLRVN